MKVLVANIEDVMREAAVPIAVYLVLRAISDRPPFTEARLGARLPRPPVRPFGRPLAVRVRRDRVHWLVLRRVHRGAARRRRVRRRARQSAPGHGVGRGRARRHRDPSRFANLLPSFVYWAEEGGDAALFRRLPSETEAEGLKVSQMLLPIKNHRFEPFRQRQLTPE